MADMSMDFVIKLLNTGVATFFSVALLWIFFKSVPVLSQIKMVMVEVKEVFYCIKTLLGEVRGVLDEVKTLLNELKYKR